LFRKKAGGTILITSFLVAPSGWVLSLVLAIGYSLVPYPEFLIFSVGLVFAWWNAFVVFAGLLAFPRFRRFLKRNGEQGPSYNLWKQHYDHRNESDG